MKTPQNAILEPIDSTNNLNIIIPLDEEGPGGAHHRYAIHRLDTGDLLGEIVSDRLTDFGNGSMPDEHSNKAQYYIVRALQELKARSDERAASGTLGTMNK